VGIRDFWRRWHISLSSWLRDYLYIPLGGNRHGLARTSANLLMTMALGGLWHGANWTFVVWGLYHGVLLALEHVSRLTSVKLPGLAGRWMTFLLVVVGWVIFRSTSLSMAADWLGKMAGIGDGAAMVPATLIVWAIVGFVMVNALPETWDIRFNSRLRWAPVYAAGFLIAYLFLNQQQSVFLYYQF
jgi:alginate O-acetyltransferase complex protein AlgI